MENSKIFGKNNWYLFLSIDLTRSSTGTNYFGERSLNLTLAAIVDKHVLVDIALGETLSMVRFQYILYESAPAKISGPNGGGFKALRGSGKKLDF